MVRAPAKPKLPRRELEIAIEQPPSSVEVPASEAVPTPLSGDGGPPSAGDEGVHVVSVPVARSPAGRVPPDAHATQAWFETYWFTVHVVEAQLVSAAVARSPAVRVVPAAHGAQA